MKTPLAFFIIFIFIFFSCSKSRTPGTSEPATVYVGGLSGTPGLTTQGVVWVNGQSTSIPNTSSVTAICISGGDVYVLQGNTYLKNGNPVTIPDVYASSSILVSGQDVYVIGRTLASSNSGVGSTAAAVYWKNGVEINLTQNLADVVAATTTGIAVSGSDVYVSGYLYVNGNDTNDAVYWKNGILHYLPDGYMAKCIAVSGNDVYVGGSSLHSSDKYWINGVEQSLGNNAWVNTITTSGSDVYIAGFTASGPDQATYWKNGISVPLPEGYAGTGIAVSGTDVYVSGNTNGGNAVFWKNTLVDTLGNGEASCIAVGN